MTGSVALVEDPLLMDDILRPVITRALTFSRGLHQKPLLSALIGAQSIDYQLTPSLPFQRKQPVSHVIGWGRKPNTRKAVSYAQKRGLPYIALEDGFIRSFGLGRDGALAMSVVLDSEGMYYDATQPSSLELALNDPQRVISAEQRHQAAELIRYLCHHQISKYNGAPNLPADQLNGTGEKVLIVDQVAGDLSLTFGAGADFSTEQMVNEALQAHPDATIYLKLHPETMAGHRRGLFDQLSNRHQLHLITGDYNPLSIIKQVDQVYVATSQMGFEALMLGKKVTCFGTPFYAGWGLTDDRQSCSRRSQKRTLEELFCIAYQQYSRYINPATGLSCELKTVLEYIVETRQYHQANRGTVHGVGFQFWKHNHVRPYLNTPGNDLQFKSDTWFANKTVGAGESVVAWASSECQLSQRAAHQSGAQFSRMEDGFLRSVGLGSDLVRPNSLIVDQRGIYYDPSQPSDLEHLLQNSVFDQPLLQRAEALRAHIVANGISKYNHVAVGQRVPSLPADRQILLVIGQVEDDASIQLGCVGDVRSNEALLKRVRALNPDAFIVYKPHPDVLAGNRKGAVTETESLFDVQLADIPLSVLYPLIDQLHTMTSLSGFEALMNGIPVHTYGLPFYAGWGLTDDQLTLDRRNRKLRLSELIAATLICYPRYINWSTHSFTSVEYVLEQLVKEQVKNGEQGKMLFPKIARLSRKLKNMSMSLINV